MPNKLLSISFLLCLVLSINLRATASGEDGQGSETKFVLTHDGLFVEVRFTRAGIFDGLEYRKPPAYNPESPSKCNLCYKTVSHCSGAEVLRIIGITPEFERLRNQMIIREEQGKLLSFTDKIATLNNDSHVLRRIPKGVLSIVLLHLNRDRDLCALARVDRYLHDRVNEFFPWKLSLLLDRPRLRAVRHLFDPKWFEEGYVLPDEDYQVLLTMMAKCAPQFNILPANDSIYPVEAMSVEAIRNRITKAYHRYQITPQISWLADGFAVCNFLEALVQSYSFAEIRNSSAYASLRKDVPEDLLFKKVGAYSINNVTILGPLRSDWSYDTSLVDALDLPDKDRVAFYRYQPVPHRKRADLDLIYLDLAFKPCPIYIGIDRQVDALEALDLATEKNLRCLDYYLDSDFKRLGFLDLPLPRK